MTISIGSKLELHNDDESKIVELEVKGFGFEISVETGNWWAYTLVYDYSTESEKKQATWMLLSLLQDGLLYIPQDREMIRRLMAIRKKKLLSEAPKFDYCQCNFPTSDHVTETSGTCGECGKLVQIYGG